VIPSHHERVNLVAGSLLEQAGDAHM